MWFEYDIWQYNMIVLGLMYLMSPDFSILDLEKVSLLWSDILSLRLSHVLHVDYAVSSHLLAKIILKKKNTEVQSLLISYIIV